MWVQQDVLMQHERRSPAYMPSHVEDTGSLHATAHLTSMLTGHDHGQDFVDVSLAQAVCQCWLVYNSVHQHNRHLLMLPIQVMNISGLLWLDAGLRMPDRWQPSDGAGITMCTVLLFLGKR